MTTTNNDYFKPVKPLDGWFSIVVGLELMGGYSDEAIADWCGVEPGIVSKWVNCTLEPDHCCKTRLHELLGFLIFEQSVPFDYSENDLANMVMRAIISKNMTLEQFADWMRVTPRTVYGWVCEGKIPSPDCWLILQGVIEGVE